MSNAPIPTQELIDSLRHEKTIFCRASADRLAELEKFSCDLIADNAGLKNEIDRLKAAFDALTSQESLDVAFKGYANCHLVMHQSSPHVCTNCMRQAISAARKYVLEGKL